MPFELPNEKLKEIFESFGAGHADNSILKAKELFSQCEQKLNMMEVRMLFTSCEIDPNGPLEVSDFLKMCDRVKNPLPPEEQIKVMFKTFDKDNSGFLEKDELQDMMSDMGRDGDLRALDGFLSYIDANGDGKISLEELLNKYRPRH